MLPQNHFNTLSRDEARSAYRVGAARALAELGLTPTEAECALRLTKQAVGENYLQTGYGLLEGGLAASLAVGAGAGALTGHLRHGLENTVAGQGDPQQDELRRKIEGYRKMKRELRTAQTAGITQ